MIEIQLASKPLLAFIGVSALLTMTPGPGVIYLVTRTLSQGRRAGLSSVFGVAVGNIVNAALSSLGLAALIAASPAAFWVIKALGAGYLLLLGLRMFFGAPVEAGAVGAMPGPSPRHFRDGFLVAALNPKTALFFAAVLPQFLETRTGALHQTFFLACAFISVALVTDTLYVLMAAAFAPLLQRRPTSQRVARSVAAATYCALGIYAALAPSSRPSSR